MNDTSRRLFKKGTKEWNAWRRHHPRAEVDLSSENLSAVDVSGADLRRVDFSNSNLTDANLSRTNLNRVRLERTNLQRTKLNRANLEEAMLINADLREADLNGARLKRANMAGCNLLTGPVIRTPSDYAVEPSIAELAFEDAEGHHAFAFVVCGRSPEVAWTSWCAVALL